MPLHRSDPKSAHTKYGPTNLRWRRLSHSEPSTQLCEPIWHRCCKTQLPQLASGHEFASECSLFVSFLWLSYSELWGKAKPETDYFCCSNLLQYEKCSCLLLFTLSGFLNFFRVQIHHTLFIYYITHIYIHIYSLRIQKLSWCVDQKWIIDDHWCCPGATPKTCWSFGRSVLLYIRIELIQLCATFKGCCQQYNGISNIPTPSACKMAVDKYI